MAIIFQDPLTLLNPVLTIGNQISEAIRVHNLDSSEATARKRAVALLQLVGVLSAEQRYDQYPHEFSGGMRQRDDRDGDRERSRHPRRRRADGRRSM